MMNQDTRHVVDQINDAVKSREAPCAEVSRVEAGFRPCATCHGNPIDVPLCDACSHNRAGINWLKGQLKIATQLVVESGLKAKDMEARSISAERGMELMRKQGRIERHHGIAATIPEPPRRGIVIECDHGWDE